MSDLWAAISTGLMTILGGWMLFDGGRALLLGDYVTPRSGRHAGQLGPWAGLVRRLGVDPHGVPVKVTFIVLGVAWLVAAIGRFANLSWAGPLAIGLGIASLWYLPVGTAVALLLIVISLASGQ